MSKYSEADFREAQFARTEDGLVAMRAFPGEYKSWIFVTTRGTTALRTDSSMPREDWVPVTGREVTESNPTKAVGNPALDGFSAGFFAGFRHAGGRIVPDPEPTIPIPTEQGARFIAYSPKWCDGAEDQREFIVAGPYFVRLDDGELFNRDVFGDSLIVTSIVKAPEAGGDDE